MLPKPPLSLPGRTQAGEAKPPPHTHWTHSFHRKAGSKTFQEIARQSRLRIVSALFRVANERRDRSPANGSQTRSLSDARRRFRPAADHRRKRSPRPWFAGRIAQTAGKLLPGSRSNRDVHHQHSKRWQIPG